jgi:hypothetical protein
MNKEYNKILLKLRFKKIIDAIKMNPPESGVFKFDKTFFLWGDEFC